MLNILVTGANGFIGRNLCTFLNTKDTVIVETYTKADNDDSLVKKLSRADVIYHLAAVNRPLSDDEFEVVNKGLTEHMISVLENLGKIPTIVFTSSTQADLDNSYGQSKLAAEQLLNAFAKRTGALIYIHRLTNVFGKWCRPNYNSVVATFCHNIANNLKIQINNPDTELKLVYIDTVIADLTQHLKVAQEKEVHFVESSVTFSISLQKLADILQSFKDMRETLVLPDFSDNFTKYLYTTYLSYLSEEDFSYKPLARADDRGSLVELLKSNAFGQIFVSSTRPGITRGNHYHHTKVEKFCVVSGQGVIRFRHIEKKEVLIYTVSSQEIEIVDIPPGYTHSIENTGSHEMIVLFWANEIFNPDFPDTYYVEV